MVYLPYFDKDLESKKKGGGILAHVWYGEHRAGGKRANGIGVDKTLQLTIKQV